MRWIGDMYRARLGREVANIRRRWMGVWGRKKLFQQSGSNSQQREWRMRYKGRKWICFQRKRLCMYVCVVWLLGLSTRRLGCCVGRNTRSLGLLLCRAAIHLDRCSHGRALDQVSAQKQFLPKIVIWKVSITSVSKKMLQDEGGLCKGKCQIGIRCVMWDARQNWSERESIFAM